MDYVESALQRVLSQAFQQRDVGMQSDIGLSEPTKPYAYIAYERDDRPGSTGEVLFYADTQDELAQRAHISRSAIIRALVRNEDGLMERLPFVVKKIYLA